MPAPAILRLRLASQQLSSPQFDNPEDLVRWMGGLQAQDYAWAKWALAVRLPGATQRQMEAAVAEGAIVRTWAMRGTIFFLPPKDARWMLKLVAPANLAASAGRLRQLELDESDFRQSQKVLTRILQGGARLLRSEIFTHLEEAGISTAGQRGYYMLWKAGLDGLLCFGALRGKQSTYALLDEVAPVAEARDPDHETALAELARRYFASHGPATLADFAWWSGLPKADARQAHESVQPELLEMKVGDQRYWHLPDLGPAKAPRPSVQLLPSFDEYLIGHQDRSAIHDSAIDAKRLPWKGGIVNPAILLDGRVAGTWKRSTTKKAVRLEASPLEKLGKPELAALEEAAARFAAYLDLELNLRLISPQEN